MAEVPKTTEDLWSPYKELHRIVSLQLSGEISLRLPDFENHLRRHKQNFITLLQNPPKNAKSREELKKGMVEGITVRGIGHQIVSKELYQEAIILSDMYDLNEFAALDLLCTAQIQLPYYPGLPRGLVAVLLYYDGRKTLAATLRLLVQARKGVMWKLNVRDEVESFATDYTDQLCESGLFHRIFDLLRNLDLSKEIDKLQQNVALGGPKHRKQVMDLFNETRLILADTVLIWSAQCGLSKANTVLLINYLREAKIEEEATGKLDNVNLHLMTAFLYSVDLSILYTREDGEEIVQNLPILSEDGFTDDLIKELTNTKLQWNCEGLQAVCLFSFGICLYSLQLMPQVHYSTIDDEKFVDAAIESQVFDFLRNIVLDNEMAFTEQFIYQRLHNLITDFIVQMFSKLKELRMRADEMARTVQQYSREGLEAPINTHRYFEQFLLLVAKFYSKDPLGKEYMLDYWNPPEVNQAQTYSYHTTPRSASLYKFIKLGGDRLPATLFVPYLNMLSSLASCPQAARHCFNMLKQTQPNFNSTVSWDHFFMSLNRYYTTLRQEAPPVADTVYKRNIYHKGITPHEIEGLHAVLSLIKAVAGNDDFSRLALCEHPGWAPLTVLLGLVSCSVPIPLKADLFYALAALSKSPETALQMWNNLEASQILVTIPSTSSYQPRGIQTELDEIESRAEEYPLTRAFLELLHELISFGIPRTLGAGPRKPGFDPYLNFIINSVFLKFHSRSYKNPGEKWQVASLALKLIKKLLTQYEPHASDFPTTNKPNEFNSSPGFHIMLLLNTKSEFLNLILYIIDEGCQLFDSFAPFAGKNFLEECTLYCLEIIERGLILQTKFFGLLSTTSCSVLLAHLSNLLLVLNQRSLRPDHCINIMKYVGYYGELPKHTLIAVKILIHITQSPATHNKLMNILLSYEDKSIRSNFVECLDETEHFDVETSEKVKESILQLLKQCLPYSAPNISHYLFGFDLKRPVSKTQFQLPGVLDFPRTCLHSLFGILRFGIIENVTKLKSELLDSAYQMLFMLVSNTNTSEPVLRYLRLNGNFFQDHLTAGIKKMNQGVNELNQISWLLKTVAVELKVISQSNQIFYLKNLLKYLIYVPEINEESSEYFSCLSKSCMATLQDSTYGQDYKMSLKSKSDNYLIKLLSNFDFNVKEIVTPKWEYFDNSTLETLLKNCEMGSNPKLIDVKKLHQIILEELSTLQNSAALGQRQAILQEIQKVLMHVLNINNSRNAASSIVKFVDGWRQVVEVTVLNLSFDIVPLEEQQVLHIIILQTLLNKIINTQLLPEVSNLLSGTVLLLLDNLRRCRIQEEKLKSIKSNLDTSNMGPFKTSCLKEILNNLIQWIITSDISIQKLRINLYSSLVTFLQLVSFDAGKELEDDHTFISRLDSTRLSVESVKSQMYISLDVLNSFGDKLVEVLCHDCVGGHEVCKMLAMASFSLLISLGGNLNWIVYMSGRGYLKCIIESILDSDSDLRGLLDPVPTNLKPLYLYESKVSLLARIASTKIGAELLLEHKLMSCFNNMKVFDYHPEISKEWQQAEVLEDFIPPVEKRYLKVWLPTFNICNAILTSLGTENESAVSQIIYFVLGRLNVMELILRAACPYLSPVSLKEIASVTSVVARTATNDLIAILQYNHEGPYDYRANLLRLQKLMLALLSRFILSDNIVKEVLCNPNETSTTYQTSNRLLYTMRIISNIFLYAKNLIANHGIKHEGVGVIFQPSLSKPLNNANNKYTNYNDFMPSLGVIVQQLISTVQYKLREKDTLEVLNRKYKEIPEMTSIDFKELNLSSEKTFDLNSTRELAIDVIKEKLYMKKLEMEHCSFIIEHSLYILWAHLDYYMLKAIPRPKNFGQHNLNTLMNLDGTLISASEATWKVSTDDISNLKHGLVSILNDSFSKQLVESAQDLCESDRRLIIVLLKKIKTLVQFVPVK